MCRLAKDQFFQICLKGKLYLTDTAIRTVIFHEFGTRGIDYLAKSAWVGELVMHKLAHIIFAFGVIAFWTNLAPAQQPAPAHPYPPVQPLAPAQPITQAPPYLGSPVAADAQAPQEVLQLQMSMKNLQVQQEAVLQAGAQDEKLKLQVDLLQKQIVTQQKMIQLLVDNMNKQTSGSVEKLETQITTLDSRSKQAAQRDKELANAVDNVVEHQNAVETNGPSLPAGLRELFLPSGNNETVLSIYGALAVGYSNFQGNAATAANGAGRPSVPGGFYFGEFTPDFLIKLNDWILLEAEIGIASDGSVGAGSFAQADFFINDWLTVIAGKYVAPIGWFNERLNNPWINKLPGDAPGSGPLLWQQVLPPTSLLGVQALGAFYLGNSPFKMEYAVYVGNGLNVTPATPGAPTIDELANLENISSTWNPVQNNKAFGGRIGLWWPEMGLEAGLSALYNTDYIAGYPDSINFWALDLNYHKGNWDVRMEYGQAYQQAGSFGFDNIYRQGFNGQVAFRPRSLPNGIFQKMEFVYRYGYVNFGGIDPTTLNLSTYSTPVDVPVRRQQNEFGFCYWFAPRLVLKFAYQINDEPGFHLHDNQFLTELAWGW